MTRIIGKVRRTNRKVRRTNRKVRRTTINGGLQPRSPHRAQTQVTSEYYRKIEISNINNTEIISEFIKDTRDTWKCQKLIYNYVIAGVSEPYIYLLPQSEGEGPLQTMDPVITGIGHSSIPWSEFDSSSNYNEAQEKYGKEIENNKYVEGDVVLYAGELGFNKDCSLAWWNSSSGHYVPAPWWAETSYCRSLLSNLNFDKYIHAEEYVIAKIIGYYDIEQYPIIKYFNNTVCLTVYDISQLRGLFFYKEGYPVLRGFKKDIWNPQEQYRHLKKEMEMIYIKNENVATLAPTFKELHRYVMDSENIPFTLMFKKVGEPSLSELAEKPSLFKQEVGTTTSSIDESIEVVSPANPRINESHEE